LKKKGKGARLAKKKFYFPLQWEGGKEEKKKKGKELMFLKERAVR